MLSPVWQRRFTGSRNVRKSSMEHFPGSPYAPPGMYQHLGKNELKWHYDWLSPTVGNDWKWENTKALGTDHESIFWVFRTGSGSVCWGGKRRMV